MTAPGVPSARPARRPLRAARKPAHDIRSAPIPWRSLAFGASVLILAALAIPSVLAAADPAVLEEKVAGASGAGRVEPLALLEAGRLQLKAGQLGSAEPSLVRAFALADEARERALQRDVAEALVSLFEKKGDYRRALEYQRAYAGLKEEVSSKQNLEKVASLETKLRAEQKERQDTALAKQQEIQALEVRRRRLSLALAAAGFVLLAAVAVFLVWRNRQKERASAELATAYARLEEVASLDALTSLANRKAAMDRLGQETRRTGRTHRPLSLLLIDVDEFKRINETRGQACGDAVLKGLGVYLLSSVRELDLAARWGGGEFLLVLPETPREGALQFAEKIRRGAERIRVHDEGTEVTFTVTIGAATFSEPLPVDECLRRLDAALYEGKRTGKNRVVAGVGQPIA